jgi:hypothetical protein
MTALMDSCRSLSRILMRDRNDIGLYLLLIARCSSLIYFFFQFFQDAQAFGEGIEDNGED